MDGARIQSTLMSNGEHAVCGCARRVSFLPLLLHTQCCSVPLFPVGGRVHAAHLNETLIHSCRTFVVLTCIFPFHSSSSPSPSSPEYLYLFALTFYSHIISIAFPFHSIQIRSERITISLHLICINGIQREAQCNRFREGPINK